jgi:hypothetical protein
MNLFSWWKRRKAEREITRIRQTAADALTYDQETDDMIEAAGRRNRGQQ